MAGKKLFLFCFCHICCICWILRHEWRQNELGMKRQINYRWFGAFAAWKGSNMCRHVREFMWLARETQRTIKDHKLVQPKIIIDGKVLRLCEPHCSTARAAIWAINYFFGICWVCVEFYVRTPRLKI